MTTQDMTQRYRKFKRTWGMYYAYDNSTGNSVSLKTRVRAEAIQKVNAMNETQRQPGISLGLARVYLNATDPKLATRAWQEVMEHIVEKKTDETRRRWDVAIKDKNFNRIRNLKVAETRAEHFDRALADGKVLTNVYLRRIHDHVLGMDWLLRPVIPRLQWPRPVFKPKRVITAEEHASVIARETNPERHDFYELLLHSLSTADLPAGTNTVLVAYLGGSNFLGSSNSLTQVVPIVPGTPSTVGIQYNADGTVTVTFAGRPEAQYVMQASDNLAPPAWESISTNTAGTDGQWTFTESIEHHPVRFYRSARP